LCAALLLPAALVAGGEDSVFYDLRQKPFYHGVASGDPLPDGILLWTRVTPAPGVDTAVLVRWTIALDTGMTLAVQQGQVWTGADRDFTVKADVTGLDAQTTYYYRFETAAGRSAIGRTRTAPWPDAELPQLRLAVVSCNHYEDGYFNAFGRIAARHDLDAVVHLGDYIYEYKSGGDGAPGRCHDSLEAVTLEQYRARYARYRLDQDLQEAHRQHPFILVWDDHESANNAYTAGAENHNPDREGDWEERKAASRQAYYEWLPVREQASGKLYRTFQFGRLASLLMLDTRLEGRADPVFSSLDPALEDPARSILGAEQRSWMLGELAASPAQWKLIGNQVLFAPLNIGWAAIPPLISASKLEGMALDIWDGFPLERRRILRYLDSLQIRDVVFLTGDIHSSFANEVADPVLTPLDSDSLVYDPETGRGALAVEFVTPSITSDNFDETIPGPLAALLEYQLNHRLPPPYPGRVNPNPHMKFVDLDRHGYLVLDLTPARAQADWYFMRRIDRPDPREEWAEGWYAATGSPRLLKADSAAAPAAEPPLPAPPVRGGQAPRKAAALQVLAVQPNPVSDLLTLRYALYCASPVRIILSDPAGRRIAQPLQARQPAGIYELEISCAGLAPGVYTITCIDAYRRQHAKVIVQH
jgi:alkaline phosphatase D